EDYYTNLEDQSLYPSQSIFYQIKDGYDISVNFNVNSSHFESDIYIDDVIKEQTKNSFFPENNLIISEDMIFRGVVIKQITFYPYSLNLYTGEIEIFDDVDLIVNEVEINETRNYSEQKLSRAFEPLYEDLIINYEVSSRDEDYQVPAVLYICGGSSLNNSYVQDLIDCRHRSGFVVYTATTSETGSNASSIKNYIQDLYENSDNPPEIVGLIGDTGGSYSIDYFTESWSGYYGPGDMPYSLLDGDDLLPEVFIGRISVNSSSDISNVINKTLAYEKATYLNQISDDWYERGALCGDPSSSGQSTVITNEYIANILDAYEFDDINGNYGSGNYSSWMQNQLDDGCLYMNYRGYYGSSGFGSNNINSANNGYKNPFAVFITCGTGDYNGTSLSEQLFRAGSVTNPKGAVAAIGTATTGTHTLFNNIVNMGIYDGIFPKDLIYAGGAMANGRLSLLWTYPSDPNNNVSIFSHWNNLMGDPALRLWTDTPKMIFAEFNGTISYGTNFIDIHIENENGVGVEDAQVTLLKGNDEIFITKKTDLNGDVRIDLDYQSPGEVLVTVIKKNHKPIESSFDISSSGAIVNVLHEDISLVDVENDLTSGNGNGILNPGELVVLNIPIINLGQTDVFGINASLYADSDNVSIISNVNQYGSLSSGENSFGSFYYLLELDDNVISSDDINLRLDISDSDDNLWQSLINLNMQAGLIVFDHIQLIDNIELNPGENSHFKIFLKNEGEIPVSNVELSLLPSGYLVDIINSETSFGTIMPGEIVESFIDLNLSVDDNAINGSVVNMNANIFGSQGYNQDIIFHLNIGHVTQHDPLGPDEHGYYIYDSGDLGYSLAPFYDWIEIDNDFNGPGTELNMSDSGDGNNISNSSLVVDLPFDFTFYGITYDEITVNTNGWISFGESVLESFRNYPIPGAGGPSPMLAAFWDDLKTTSNAEIYTYAGENYFIIEWSEMRTYNNNDIETFQIILYDNTSLTPTGDNEIKIQYKTFNNTSQGSYNWGGTHGGYSTIGIENHLSDIGLQYTFNNEYPTASMPLSDNTAIFITTRNPVATLMGDGNQDGEVNILDLVVIVNHIINLEILDPMGVYMSDMNDSGDLNILDIIQIINIILDND
ncbi:MAG: hypothetical protein CMD65_03510, partial [Gammaproteobacteria bacterium]|nr:hypothetical protein [Gammaproteobacteria bacterium]